MSSTSDTTPSPSAGSLIAAILAGGFMAATFDFFAAMLIYGGTASGVAKAIARGWFGMAVKAMPPIVDVIGIASHYGILLIAASIFVLTSLRFPVLRQRDWITGPLFGVCIYIVMHFVIVQQPQGDPVRRGILRPLVRHRPAHRALGPGAGRQDLSAAAVNSPRFETT
jgi:type IV secretory pathway TrbD component